MMLLRQSDRPHIHKLICTRHCWDVCTLGQPTENPETKFLTIHIINRETSISERKTKTDDAGLDDGGWLWKAERRGPTTRGVATMY